VKILVSWLRAYVDVPVGIDQLAKDLTMRGFEVASIDRIEHSNGTGEDAVIDFEITANRPDCLSVLGMAREVAVCYGVPLRDPAAALQAEAADLPLRVSIEAPALCPTYAAAVVDVEVGPSPEWLATRLAHCGIRAINNVVDVTNYVLLETGQPLHAFDYETVGGRHLRVRTARPGERVTTLDGQERALTPEMLVIADETRAQAVAGVMGGAETEISAATRVVALESAYFEPAQVRRTRRALGLSTEASYRFERGADPTRPVPALLRALALLTEIGAGRPRPGILTARGQEVPQRQVRLRWTRIERVLGMQVPADQVEAIFTGLGFIPARALDDDPHAPPVWDVAVPGWRGDVTREEDLIEEVARCAGYEQLPVTFPPLTAPPARVAPRLARDRDVRDVLVGQGCAECVTFTFIERPAAEPFDAAPVAIANPLSEKFAVLRPSLLPGLIDSLSHNRRREQHDLRLFEVGTRFTRPHGETRSVAFGLAGRAAAEHWSGSGRLFDVYDALGVVARVARLLGVTIDHTPADHPALRDGHAVRLVRRSADGATVEVGIAGQLAPALADARGLPGHEPVFVGEIDLDLAAPDYAADRLVLMTPLPRHPSVVRDVSLLVRADLPAAGVRGTMQAAAPETLVRVTEFDRYVGKSLPEGMVSLSFRLTFRHPDRTLTDAEVQAAMDTILAAVSAAHGTTLR
jgi:phenylalanyl-tRNA synthetase beta chain